MEHLLQIIGVILGCFAYRFGVNLYRRRRVSEYSWRCEVPNCHSEASSNNLELVLRISEWHRKHSHT